MRREKFDISDWEYDYSKGSNIYKNGTEYDDDGYNYYGLDKDGYDERGFKIVKDFRGRMIIHKNGTKYDDDGFDYYGFDKDGYDVRGFKKVRYHSRLFIHKNGTRYDDDGFDYSGFNKEGYDKEGYNKSGFNEKGFHRNGTRYDDKGFDREGYDKEGYNKLGFNEKGFHRNGTEYDDKGYNKDGFDKNGYNYYGIDKDGYNEKGYDYNGFDREGFHFLTGLNKNGLTREQVEEGAKQRRSNYLGLMSKAEKLSKGEMSLEEYIMKSKTSIDDLITFAKKKGMSADVIRGLYRFKKTYNAYKKPFSKKEYLSSTILLIDGEEVRPTEQDVDMCVEYLKVNGSLICDKTVRKTISQYKRGEVDITIKEEDLQQQIEENETIIEENEETIKEALVDVSIAEQKKIKSQEAEISDLKSQRRDIDE